MDDPTWTEPTRRLRQKKTQPNPRPYLIQQVKPNLTQRTKPDPTQALQVRMDPTRLLKPDPTQQVKPDPIRPYGSDPTQLNPTWNQTQASLTGQTQHNKFDWVHLNRPTPIKLTQPHWPKPIQLTQFVQIHLNGLDLIKANPTGGTATQRTKPNPT